jgi:hypothetical protein
MIRILLISIIALTFAAGTINAQAIKRVAKKEKDDSSKTESVVRKQKSDQESKADTNQPKDEFIDRNGDGINDQVTRQKTPVIKKQDPLQVQQPEIQQPKQPEIQAPKPKVIEAQPPKIKAPEQKPQKPKVAEPQKQKPKEPEIKESSSSQKKSKR